jgi:2-dehydropantoate 2-reductase
MWDDVRCCPDTTRQKHLSKRKPSLGFELWNHGGVVLVDPGKGKDQVFGIVGVGPVGSVLAGHLAKHGWRVVLVDILKNHLDTIRTKGLVISGFTQINVKIDDICYSIPELKKHHVDAVFISVKASILPRILKEVREATSPATYAISFQNGLDTEQFIAKEFGDARTLRCVVNYAGNLIADGHVDMTFFNKPNYVGTISSEADEFAKRIAHVMTSVDLETEFTDSIRKYTWEKTILNAGMSALCSVTKQTMSDAMEFQPTREIIEALVKEGIEAAKSDGFDYGPGFFDFCMGYLGKAGRHKPSMLIDVENQRPTEIDFLNGKIVEYGGKFGIPTPYNQTITNIVKALEAGYTKA